MAAIRFASVCCIFSTVQFANAGNPDNRFAKRSEPFLGRYASTRPSLQGDVEQVLHSEYRADTNERLQDIQAKLQTTFAALPKNERGLLGMAATRYLLNRHFHRSRGWLVHGLRPDGHSWNSTSPTAILKNKTQGSVAAFFDQRLKGYGLDLSEVALLAAMIENEVHQDTVSRLRKAWGAQLMPEHGKIELHDVERVLDTYMMGYILHDDAYMNPKLVARALAEVQNVYPNWNHTQSFVRATLRQTAPRHGQALAFADVEHVVVAISERYGDFQYDECKGLKLDLLAIEGSRPGRVDLGDFFRKALYDGEYQFGESVAYLKDVGLLDQSSPRFPSVIVPNYINSPSQLVANSDNYAVTCLDECEGIMARIEERVAASYTSPEQITSFLYTLPADMRPLPTDDPNALLTLLRQVAQVHGGEVPLHGRLFAQWLHHAYPRECPYPYVSGSTIPMEPEEYNALKGGKHAAYAQTEEMTKQVKRKASLDDDGVSDGGALPWDATEELLEPRTWLRVPLLPAFLVPYVQLAGCVTVLALLLPNLALINGVNTVSSGKGDFVSQIFSK